MARPKVYTDETQPYSLTIRIPRDLFDQMERYTGHQGRSRTDAMIEGLTLWLERQASSTQLSHDNNNSVMHELNTPAHFLDDGIPFDDEHLPVPAPETPAIAHISHGHTPVIQEATPTRRSRKVKFDVSDVSQDAQRVGLVEEQTRDGASPGAVPAYDTSKYRLGTLCKAGHDYLHTGQSLRTTNKAGYCLACNALGKKRERDQAKRQGDTAEKADKAALVARLQQMHAGGMSLQRIADQLRTEGLSTLSGKGQWQKGTVAKLLAAQIPRRP
jgi:hypothetical protein